MNSAVRQLCCLVAFFCLQLRSGPLALYRFMQLGRAVGGGPIGGQPRAGTDLILFCRTVLGTAGMAIEVLGMYRGIFIFQERAGPAGSVRQLRCHVNGERIDAGSIEALRERVDCCIAAAAPRGQGDLIDRLQGIICGELTGDSAKATVKEARESLADRQQKLLEVLNAVIKAEAALATASAMP